MHLFPITVQDSGTKETRCTPRSESMPEKGSPMTETEGRGYGRVLALGVRVYSVRCTEALEAAGGLYFWAVVGPGQIWPITACTNGTFLRFYSPLPILWCAKEFLENEPQGYNEAE
ncbi:hypothetical protein V6Z11_A06G185000 [Gossypium hirsutum]